MVVVRLWTDADLVFALFVVQSGGVQPLSIREDHLEPECYSGRCCGADRHWWVVRTRLCTVCLFFLTLRLCCLSKKKSAFKLINSKLFCFVCLRFPRWRDPFESSGQESCSGHHRVWPCWLFAGCQGDGEFRRQRYVDGNTQDLGPQSKMSWYQLHLYKAITCFGCVINETFLVVGFTTSNQKVSWFGSTLGWIKQAV